jgi:hypothetical protein
LLCTKATELSTMPTHQELETFNDLVNTAIVLMATESSDSSSSIGDYMDWSFDTYLYLLCDDDSDDDDDDDSTIGAVLKLVVEYGTMIYGEENDDDLPAYIYIGGVNEQHEG